MGSKTRIALSQLQSRPETQPDPQERTSSLAWETFQPVTEEGTPPGETAETPRATAAETHAETGEVIPAFLPYCASEGDRPEPEEETEEKAESAPPGEAADQDPEPGMSPFARESGDGDGADGDTATAEAAAAPLPGDAAESQAESGNSGIFGETENSEALSDPELLALLEQLSVTLDNANRILAERPAILSRPADEYAGIEQQGEPETPAPAAPPPERDRARTGAGSGLMPAALTTGLFLAMAGGGFWWFQTNPWLLEGWRNHDTALSLTRKDETRLASMHQPREAGIPVPTAAIPSAQRAPERPEGDMEAAAAAAAGKAPETPASADPAAGRTQIAALPQQPAEPAAPRAQPPEQNESAPGHGPAGEPIDLGLSLPASQADVEISVMVQGVPEDARLSHGSEIGGGAWVLEEGHVEKAALITPKSFPPQEVSLEVAYVKSDGNIPESRSVDLAVEPARASAEPAGGGAAKAGGDKPEPTEKTLANTAIPGKPAAAGKAQAERQPAESAGSRLSAEEEQRLLERAREHLERGDIASARLLLDHAARQGSRRAMIALGETYDPKHLAKHDIHGVRADTSQAMAWYERASRLTDR